MRQVFRIVAVAGMAVSAAGCLQKETTHTLYLSPDGAFVWTALEKDVHSDETKPDARRKEEADYLTAASLGTHGVGLGLVALDPVRTRTSVLHDRRPYLVMTEAEFTAIDRVFDRLFSEVRVPGYAVLRHEGSRTSLVIHADLRTEPDSSESSAVEALIEDLDRYRIVLTDGRFVAASGFVLHNGATAAVPALVTEEELAARGRLLDLTLTWER
jgi:hypothetical protein